MMNVKNDAMNIGAIQCKAIPGDISANIERHLKFLRIAAEHNVNLLFFPELSIIGYEPPLAKSLAMTMADPALEVFREQSQRYDMTVGVGVPLAQGERVQIGMAWFVPGKPPLSYAKQQLHDDELPFFVPGEEQIILRSGNHTIAPAICYESLQPDHADHAAAMGANVYLASVAKPEGGMTKAVRHYPKMAQKHDMYVIMANCIGLNDDFVSVGRSAAWDRNGEMLTQMDGESEGILMVDLERSEASIHTVREV
jgi:predicted amidohydrolase